MNFILEAIDAPPPGWSGRRRYIARELAKVFLGALFFLLFLVSMIGCVLLVAAAMDIPTT